MAEKRVEDLVRPLKDAVEAVTEALSHSRPSVRCWAAWTLAEWFRGAYDAVSVFHRVPNKEPAAVFALDALGERVANIVQALKERLDDPAAEVRDAVRDALARIRNG